MYTVQAVFLHVFFFFVSGGMDHINTYKSSFCKSAFECNGPVVASYVASEDDQIMLVTNSGKLIRIRVHGGEGDSIRVAGRKTQGVRLFDVDHEEKVVSVALLTDSDEEDDLNENDNEVATE